MKKTAAQKIRLGVFVVLGTLLLIAALYFIGNRQNLFGKNITLNAMFSNVNGLQPGNNVRYSGIDVGTVNKIIMVSDTIIRVEMLVKENMGNYIKQNAVATIGSDGLVGNMIVNILPREGVASSVRSGDTIPTYSRIGTDDMLTTLNVTNENAALLTADLLKITSEIVNGKGTLGMLINDSIMAQDLRRTVMNLKNTSWKASQTMDQINTYLEDIKNTESVANVLLTDSVSGQKIQTLILDLEASGKQINSLTENLNELALEVQNEKGTFSYLTKNENVPKEVDSILTNIKESTARFNENMEALKHNFLFRGYFKKLERKEKRRIRDSLKNQ